MPSRSADFLRAYGKVLLIMLTMLVGTFVPQAQVFSFLIQYLLMLMLFFAFLDIDIRPKTFQKGVLWVLLANLAIAFLGYGLLSHTSHSLALVAFITGIAPTAISSPIIIGFIEGQVEYLVASVLLTNVSMALVVPLALPFLVGAAVKISVWGVLQPVLLTMFVPLLLARLVTRLPAPAQTFLRKGKPFSFSVWLLNLFIICAKASHFVRTENSGSMASLLPIALVALVICIINFSLGALIGGRQHWQEASQALGQKNNSFVIWVALTFINPLIAMGPTFYVLYHNLYNSFQIYLFEKRNKNG
jgi:bile acid:Na+ symporter, BASS family